MRKAIISGVILYIFMEIHIYLNSKKEDDMDYMEPPNTIQTPTNIKLDTLVHFHNPDTTAYKGNWIDINE